MTSARVAVIVRTKDRPDFLRRALASITGQRLTEWECVIVNDGGAQDPVDRLVAEFPEAVRDRISVIHSPESRGRWKSANAGVLATSAPLVVLHDDDDTWHPDFLLRAADYLDANPDRDGAVSRIEIVWERREANAFIEDHRELFQSHLQDLLLSDALLFNRFVPIGFVYRRSLHEELGLYDERLPVIGDWAFILKVLSRGPLPFLDGEPLAYWHQRMDAAGAEGNSVIDSRDDHARYDALLRDEALREYVSKNDLGLVLYLTKFIDQRFVDVENGIRDELKEQSSWARARSWGRRRLGRD